MKQYRIWVAIVLMTVGMLMFAMTCMFLLSQLVNNRLGLAVE